MGEAVEHGSQSPARAEKVITVGATDITDAKAWYSNYGAGVGIFAP
jgi:subtilisin family serine protease